MSPFGFWAPLFLGGIGLLVLPWLIHRIRRPEREAVTFSSLLFIPDIKQEVIERRRVQHPLLMAIRMLMLFLLAFAFARPYLFADPVVGERTNRSHLIMVDTSLSTSGSLDEIRERVVEILDTLTPTETVGLATFGSDGRILVPIVDEREIPGNTSRVQNALEQIASGYEATDYVRALAFAERHLLASSKGDTTAGLTLHLITDFQESGRRDHSGGWRMTGRIDFKGYSVAAPENNASLTDLRLDATPNANRIRARVRNPSDQTIQTTLSVHLAGQQTHIRELTIPAGNSRQAAFELDLPEAAVNGHIHLSNDDLLADNTRYFAWTPPRKPVVSFAEDTARLTRNLISAALPADRWDVRSEASGAPEALRISDRPGNNLAFVKNGGRLFVPLSGERLSDWNKGWVTTGIRLSQTQKSQTTLSEIDLSHPIFAPLSGPRFNDFSAIRFTDPIAIETDDTFAGRVLARFDNGMPAIVDIPIDEGRVILWAGGVSPKQSNLPRSPRFIPLLVETVDYLVDRKTVQTEFTVGERLSGTDARVQTVIESKEATRSQLAYDQAPTHPGWLTQTLDGEPIRVGAINFDSRESDPTRIPIAEFQLRLCQADQTTHAAITQPVVPGESAPRVEHGFLFLVAAALLLLAENVYAARLRTA